MKPIGHKSALSVALDKIKRLEQENKELKKRVLELEEYKYKEMYDSLETSKLNLIKVI
jgi:hypothetical protein